ncbi:MAG: Ig-like domain-containing protein, partial [Solirubrobacteraceae bacterium]
TLNTYTSSSNLHFPALTSPACAIRISSATCNQSVNDLDGVGVSGATIDDGVPYDIGGNQVALGAGGLTAAPSLNDTTGGSPYVSLPLRLTAPQTWTISGGAKHQQLTLAGAVTGSSYGLTVALRDETALSLYGDDEVGAVTVTGAGTASTFQVGFPDNPASLNATTRNPVTVSGGVEFVADSAATGPLTVTGGSLQVGDAYSGGTLVVSGAAAVDSTTSVSMYIHRPGTRAGTDFSQLSATGNVNLGGARLDLGGEMLDGEKPSCPALTPGDVDTLVKTTGSLTGTFAGVPDGATIPLDCPDGRLTAPRVRINYTEDAVTATVVSSDGTATRTSLSASPADALTTNQSVTLSATVAVDSSTTGSAGLIRTMSADSIGNVPMDPVPVGTVEFDDNGTPIAGCLNRRLVPGQNAGAATCQTAFGADSSGDTVTAVFRPADGTDLQGSMDGTHLVVAKGSTTTTVSVSDRAPTLGQSVTYAATVAPDAVGVVDPSGNAQFLDGGMPIDACARQPLVASASSPVATCTVSYSTVGSHQITAAYVGDQNFTGSTSSEAQTVTVGAAPTSTGSNPPTSGGLPTPQTPPSTTPPPPASGPHCKLVLRTDHVLTTHGNRNPRSRTKAGLLKLSARCDQDVTVAARVTINLLPGTTSRRGRVFHLQGPDIRLKAGRTRAISLRLPAAAVAALAHGRRETAVLMLNAGSTGGTQPVLLRVPALKL